jgi:hypothetical protein
LTERGDDHTLGLELEDARVSQELASLRSLDGVTKRQPRAPSSRLEPGPGLRNTGSLVGEGHQQRDWELLDLQSRGLEQLGCYNCRIHSWHLAEVEAEGRYSHLARIQECTVHDSTPEHLLAVAQNCALVLFPSLGKSPH